MGSFSLEHFASLLKPITDAIADDPLDKTLEAKLTNLFPPSNSTYKAIEATCVEGIQQQAMCQHEAGGIRYGRVIKPGSLLGDMSVDVVEMDDIAGPHHRHPNGEIDLIFPLTQDAEFDGCGAGWLVYEAGSAHSPTVTHGRAIVLYLLPQGAIEFTRN